MLSFLPHHDEENSTDVATNLYTPVGRTDGCAATGTPSDVGDDDPTLLVDGIYGYYPALDLLRFLCICMVVADHGGTAFGHWNTMFVQSWVIQWLWLIAGICFGMTSRGFWYYLVRLAGYFFVGVLCNGLAWAVTGHDPIKDVMDVIFQFWFVFDLIVYAAVLTPVKKHLQSVIETNGARKPSELAQIQGGRYNGWGSFKYNPMVCIALLSCGFFTISAATHAIIIPLCQKGSEGTVSNWVFNYVEALGSGGQWWGFPTNDDELDACIAEIINYFLLSVKSLFLIVAFPRVSDHLQYTGWLVLLNIYFHRMFQYRSKRARVNDGFDYTMVGMTCFYYGLAHRRVVGEYMCRYWHVLLLLSCLLWPPGTYGRFDEEGITDSFFRMRYILLEFGCTVFFFCCMERIVDKDIWLEDKAYWLNNFGLILFLVHKAVHIMVPQPYNWAIFLGLAPICWLLLNKAPWKKRAA